jgi:hypothetical protein
MSNPSTRRRNCAPTEQSTITTSDDPVVEMLHRLWVRLAIRRLKKERAKWHSIDQER